MSNLIYISVSSEKNLSNKLAQIRLPAVPRVGETLTLPDAHYLVRDVFYQTHPDVTYTWADEYHYTVRLLVEKKFPDDV